MNNLDLLAGWLDDDVEVKIHHTFGTSDFEYRINYELANLDHLPFFSNPLGLCQDAAALIDGSFDDISHPVAGRILTEFGPILYQYFPGSYGFSAKFSLLPEDRYVKLTGDNNTFKQQAREILSPGWHDSMEDKFTKFELLREKHRVKAEDALEIVSVIEKELIDAQRSDPQNSGGHTSDHFTWYQAGIEACEVILSKYE